MLQQRQELLLVLHDQLVHLLPVLARVLSQRRPQDRVNEGFEDQRELGLECVEHRPRTDEDARYYTNWGYSDVAFDSGYRDGLSAGRKDFSERKDYRPEKHDSYEDGDHGYRKSFGTKEQYKEQYRKGFLRGYEDAFNRRGH